MSVRNLLLFLLLSFLAGGSFGAESTCDLAKYNEWKNQLYTGPLASDSTFWIYQTQKKEIFLTNYLALELAVTSCTRKFDQLYYYLAGKMGPIDIQHSYKTMCRDVCMESDAIHESAMAYSHCSCLELSTQPNDPSFHIEGDFCRHNSARLLCDKVGYCGVWNCRIDDFMCPRYEWNKKIIPFKGIGSCERGAASAGARHWSAAATLGIAAIVGIFAGAIVL
jgi:hypothetical protein